SLIPYATPAQNRRGSTRDGIRYCGGGPSTWHSAPSAATFAGSTGGSSGTGSPTKQASRPMADSKATHSARAAEPVGAYPHARGVGNLLFLAGIGPRKRGSKDIPGVRLD